MDNIIRPLIENPIAIVFLVFLLGMYPLGTTGLWIRKGVETKKQLEKLKNEAEGKGYTINEKWHKLNSQANWYIWGPIWGWIFGYFLIFVYCKPIEFFFSLLGLIIPAFGYFGKRFWLSAD